MASINPSNIRGSLDQFLKFDMIAAYAIATPNKQNVLKNNQNKQIQLIKKWSFFETGN